MLFVCGGFYDGRKPIVEPLSNAVFMLRDYTNTRHIEVATLLWALARGILLSQSLDDLGITLGECLERTRWSSPLDSTTYLYYFTSGCTPITT